MSVTGTKHHTLHSVAVAAPAEVVYGIVADVTKWPQYFGPNVHVEHLEQDAGSERIRIWATANGAVKTWVSRRTFDAERLRVDFRQEVSAPPVAGMGGAWVVSPLTPGPRCSNCTTTSRPSATPPSRWTGSTRPWTATARPS